MDSYSKTLFWLGRKINKIKRTLKGSLKDPFLCFVFVAIFLFGLVALGSCPLLKSLNNAGDFSVAALSKSLESQPKNELFLSPTKKFGAESPELFLVDENSLKAASPPGKVTSGVLAQITGAPPANNEIIKHIVEEGESLWEITRKYDLNRVETIIWVNNLKDAIIRPGQELTILPVDGLVHIVKAGESLAEIAENYKADMGEIISFNEIASASEIFERQALIIPGGELPSSGRTTTFVNLSTNDFYGLSHAYPYGQCTWWVAQKRAIPGWGNARDWLDNAVASGFPVCKGSYCTPQTGAVIATKGSYLGHVGYVERVTEGKVVFSEMNYVGWGTMNYRSLTIGDSRILGYIYKTY